MDDTCCVNCVFKHLFYYQENKGLVRRTDIINCLMDREVLLFVNNYRKKEMKEALKLTIYGNK